MSLTPYDTIEALIHIAATNHLAQTELLRDLKEGRSVAPHPEDNISLGTLEFLAATGHGKIGANGFSLSDDSYLLDDRAASSAKAFISWLDGFVGLYWESRGFPDLVHRLGNFPMAIGSAFQTEEVIPPFKGALSAIAFALMNHGANESRPDLVNDPLQQINYFLQHGNGNLESILASLIWDGHISNGRELTETGRQLAIRSGQAHLTTSYVPVFVGLPTAARGVRNYDVLQPANAIASNALIGPFVVPRIISVVGEHASENRNRVTLIDLGSGGGQVIRQLYANLSDQYKVTVVGFDKNRDANRQASKMFDPSEIDKSVYFVKGDMLCREDMRRLLITYRPDMITINYLLHDIGTKNIASFLANLRNDCWKLGLNPLLVISESYRPTPAQLRTNPNFRYFVALHDWSGQSMMPRHMLHELLRNGSYEIKRSIPIVQRGSDVYNEVVVAKMAPKV